MNEGRKKGRKRNIFFTLERSLCLQTTLMKFIRSTIATPSISNNNSNERGNLDSCSHMVSFSGFGTGTPAIRAKV